MSYLLKEASGEVRYCFCGDLILPAGLGNTHLLGGSAEQMADSLILLAQQLTPEAVICSGHDYQQCFAMNWAVQQQQTPLLSALLSKQITKDEFAAKKQQHDEQKQTDNNNQLCGYVNAQPDTNTQQLSYSQAKEMLSHGNVYLIDTREPYEHGANNISSLLNVATAKTLNIPLSRMANAIVEQQLDKNNQYILVCRSGNRSKLAAANLIELGYTSVYNLNGGLALGS